MIGLRWVAGAVIFTGCVGASAQKTRLAQQTAPAPLPEPLPSLAPVPSSLLNAKTVFISNAGADSGLFPHPFNGDPDRAYNEFYAAVMSWGRYQVVASPAQADLVFELQLTAPNGPSNANKSLGASDPLPMLRLVIYDRPTHYVLWALTESVLPATLQKSHDHNFDEAVSNLMLDAGRLTKSLPSAMH
jgi:hypothetical protein